MDYFASNQSFRTIFHNVIYLFANFVLFCGFKLMLLNSEMFKFFNNKLSKNSDYAFPFAKASIHMVQFVCDFLNIGKKGISK